MALCNPGKSLICALSVLPKHSDSIPLGVRNISKFLLRQVPKRAATKVTSAVIKAQNEHQKLCLLNKECTSFYISQRFQSKGKSDGKKSDGKKPDPKKAWEEHCVVPDVIPCPPKDVAEICFPGGGEVNLGNCLTPTQTKDEPSTSIVWPAEKECFYTISLVDPDAPCRASPELREWVHWLVVNIPGCDICSGEFLVEYVGSAPPKDTGLHRYVFLIYKQRCKMEFKDFKKINNKTAKGREKFKIHEFAQKYEMGDPVAGNFYQAEYDDYVPIINKQLGIA